jgi:hypothetical protein
MSDGSFERGRWYSSRAGEYHGCQGGGVPGWFRASDLGGFNSALYRLSYEHAVMVGGGGGLGARGPRGKNPLLLTRLSYAPVSWWGRAGSDRRLPL